MSGIFLKSNGDQNDIKNVEFSRETKENDSGQKPGRNDPHAAKRAREMNSTSPARPTRMQGACRRVRGLGSFKFFYFFTEK
jgi:hypothetical protein